MNYYMTLNLMWHLLYYDPSILSVFLIYFRFFFKSINLLNDISEGIDTSLLVESTVDNRWIMYYYYFRINREWYTVRDDWWNINNRVNEEN